MNSGRTRATGWVVAFALLAGVSAEAAPGSGKLSGVVLDLSGVPQMGASVWVVPEGPGRLPQIELLTNERGVFSTARLQPGLYTLRVTLAGFLPTLERHVRISSNLTTLVKVQLDSVFASVDRLRRTPVQPSEADDWKWVLRTSAPMRPVLQWADGQVVVAGEPPSSSEVARRRRPRGRLELTNGALRSGSAAYLTDSPATAFSYDQPLGRAGRVLMAAQMSYEHTAAGGLAAVWLPSGEFGKGPQTTFVAREAKLGPEGPFFRGLRLAHSDQLSLGDRFLLHYGAEYVTEGVDVSTAALRPHGSLDVALSPAWSASLLAAAEPQAANDLRASALQSALAQLDTLPAILWRNGRPLLESGWHEELAVNRRLGSEASLQVAAFHDAAQHQAVFGYGAVSNPDFFRDPFSDAFVYDGGASGSWGARIGYKRKLHQDWEVSTVYAWGGVLAPEDLATAGELRDAFQTRYRHSLAARVAGKVPRLGTQVAANYKWLSGPAVTRQDSFGEALYQLDPGLNFSIRQPLPNFLMNGRWEALADFRNLLAQGYVPISARDGRVVLVPMFRSFRGGVSFQF